MADPRMNPRSLNDIEAELSQRLEEAKVSYQGATIKYKGLMAMYSDVHDIAGLDGNLALRTADQCRQAALARYEQALNDFTDFVLRKVLGAQDSKDRTPSNDTLSASEQERAKHLTPREKEVLKLIAEGRTTKEAARILGVSFKTLACHRYRIRDKLEIHDTATLVRFAIRAGLTKL